MFNSILITKCKQLNIVLKLSLQHPVYATLLVSVLNFSYFFLSGLVGQNKMFRKKLGQWKRVSNSVDYRTGSWLADFECLLGEVKSMTRVLRTCTSCCMPKKRIYQECRSFYKHCIKMNVSFVSFTYLVIFTF